MRLVADAHISPRTAEHLRSLGHDVIRVGDECLSQDATDDAIVTFGRAEDRVILTQDLDFSQIVALSGTDSPSVISLRLSSATVANVNNVLQRVLPSIEQVLLDGSIVTIEDTRIRTRQLPIP